MVPLQITSSGVLVQRDHIHARGAVDEVLVVGGMVQTPDFNLPAPCTDMTPKRESIVPGTWADGPQPGECQLQLFPQLCGAALLAERTRTLGKATHRRRWHAGCVYSFICAYARYHTGPPLSGASFEVFCAGVVPCNKGREP